MKPLIKKEEAARLLAIGVRTLETLMKRGEIPFVKRGISVRFRPESLEQFIANSEIRKEG